MDWIKKYAMSGSCKKQNYLKSENKRKKTNRFGKSKKNKNSKKTNYLKSENKRKKTKRYGKSKKSKKSKKNKGRFQEKNKNHKRYMRKIH